MKRPPTFNIELIQGEHRTYRLGQQADSDAPPTPIWASEIELRVAFKDETRVISAEMSELWGHLVLTSEETGTWPAGRWRYQLWFIGETSDGTRAEIPVAAGRLAVSRRL